MDESFEGRKRAISGRKIFIEIKTESCRATESLIAAESFASEESLRMTRGLGMALLTTGTCGAVSIGIVTLLS
jgi:hypothetical protein